MLHRIKIGVLLHSLVFFFLGEIDAQSYFLHHFSTADGLPSSSVFDIAQDSSGLIWFGTESGLASYDGKEFNSYTVRDGIPNNVVIGICVDNSNKLWLSTMGHPVSIFEDGRARIPSWVNDVLSGGPANIEYFDSNKSLYFLTNENLGFLKDQSPIVYKMGLNDDFPIPSGVRSGLRGRPFEIDENIVFPYGQERIYWITKEGKVDSLEFKIEDNEFLIRSVDYEISNNPKAPATLSDVAKIESREVLLYAQPVNGKVFSFSVKGRGGWNVLNCWLIDIEKKKAKPVLESYFPSLQQAKVKSVFSDKHNNLWIATGDGVYLVRNLGLPDQKVEKILSGNSISNIFFDNEGNTWIATEGSGVYLMISSEIKSYQSDLVRRGNGIQSLKTDTTTGYTWIGYSNGFLEVLNQFDSLLHQRKISLFKITDIEFSGDEVYLSTNSEFFVCSKSKFELLKSFKLVIAIKSLLPWDGIVYVLGSQLLRFDRNGEFRVLQGLKSSRIYSSIGIDENEIWLGTTNGLIGFDTKRDTFTGLVLPELDMDIRAIKKDSSGHYWLATQGWGVIEFDGEKVLQYITSDDGLSSNICYDIEIANGIMWVSTNVGVNRISLHSNDISTLDISNGLSSQETFDLEVLNNQLLIGGGKGMDMVPLDFKQDFRPPVLDVKSFKINGLEADYRSKLPIAISQSIVEVELQALSYRSLGKIEYAYLLSSAGSPVEDYSVSKSNKIDFLGLSPNNYSLLVKARGHNTDWSKEIQLNFEIIPPWYKRGSFYFLCALLLLLAAFLIVRRILRRQKMQADLDNQLKELELTALRAQMNPHFLFNALNSIQWFVNRNDADSANLYMAKFATLIRKILINSGKKYISLAEEMEQLELYVSLENLRMDGSIDFEITCEDTIDPGWIFVPTMLIQPYVENAILHGLVPQKNDRRLQIHFSKASEKLLSCSIFDSGIGIKESLLRKQDQGGGKRPRGMQMTSKRLEIINKEAHNQVSVQVKEEIDKKLDTVLGTSVLLHIPISHDSN